MEESLRDAENRLSRAKQDSLMNESAVTRLRSNCTTLEVDLKSYQVRHAALSDQIFQLKEENSSLERRCEELSAAMENANERLGNAEADITEAVAKADELRAQYRNQQAEIQQMDRQLASKSAKLSLLNDLQSRMEGFSEGVKAIMKGRLGECLDPLNLKIVSQNVEVADGWTSAFETMLGSAVDAVAIEDSSKLPQALALLRERNLGNACFQIKDANLNAISDADALPQGIWRGCDIVKPQDPDLSEYVRNMVAGCYFCEDIMQFANFALNNKNFKFMAAVAKDGSMLDARGIIYASSGEKRDTQSSFILRNSEIKRIKEEIEVDNDALTTLNERAMQIQSQLESAEAEIENRKNLSSEIKREIASINAQSSSAKAAFSEKNSEIEKKTAAMAEMENSRFEAQDRLNSAMKALEDAEKSISESRNLISETEAQIAELRETKDQKYAVLSETRLELAAKKSRLESLERGLGAIREQQAETRALIERRTIESQSIARQIENFDAETLSERERAKNLAENLEAALGEIEAQRVKVAESETSIAEYENSLSAEREAHMRKTSEKNECQIRIAKIRSKLDFISERILSEYDVEIANVDWKSELWKSDEEFEIKVKLDELEDGEINAKPKRERGDPTQDDLDAMESTDFSPIEDEVRELRERINAMGAVNLVAIEEYAELKERYDFLKTQTDDLWASKNALVADIDEINATSQKLFSETFEQIRKNFAFTFQKIFGGGTADLRLVESEDVLDSGIEIVARPAGTVLKSLSLLSGGQRTMTAVSLLFAIYMVKPSPFCVLDELDAPLDDANIGRYTDMLKEFTRYSQFLVISHNKRTMSAAQTLYGVTMQERGVTRLISMRFNGESTSSGE